MGQRFAAQFMNHAKNFMVLLGFPDFDGYAVTPADGTDLPNGPCKAIYATGAGNIAGNLVGGGTFLLTGLSAGQIVAVQAQRIAATSTTATGMFALY